MNIQKVVKLQQKLDMFMKKHVKGMVFDSQLGINPENGKYTIEVRVTAKKFLNAFPSNIDGIKVNVEVQEKKNSYD